MPSNLIYLHFCYLLQSTVESKCSSPQKRKLNTNFSQIIINTTYLLTTITISWDLKNRLWLFNNIFSFFLFLCTSWQNTSNFHTFPNHTFPPHYFSTKRNPPLKASRTAPNSKIQKDAARLTKGGLTALRAVFELSWVHSKQSVCEARPLVVCESRVQWTESNGKFVSVTLVVKLSTELDAHTTCVWLRDRLEIIKASFYRTIILNDNVPLFLVRLNKDNSL